MRLPVIFLVIAIICALAGCGGSSVQTNVTASPKALSPTNSPAAITFSPARTPAPTPAPTPTPLLTASAANLLALADLPSGWSLEDPDPGSAIADPSLYSACGASPATPIDVGFSLDASIGEFVGQTIVSYPSVNDASGMGVAAAVNRVKSCTQNDNNGTSTSIKVSAQAFTSYGDESAAFRVDIESGSGPALGYVVVVRKANLVTTFFYFDLTNKDNLTLLDGLTRIAVNRLGT